MNTFRFICWSFGFLAYVFQLKVIEAADDDHEFMNEWAVRIPDGDAHADLIARDHGYENLGKIMGFEDVYLMRKSDVQTREKRESGHHTRKLNDDFRVEWAEQQVIKRRDKRGYENRMGSGSSSTFDSPLPQSIPESAAKSFEIAESVGKSIEMFFNDAQWPDQWYLKHSNSCLNNCGKKVVDLNVVKAWASGYTGKNVVVCILDDGLEWNHTDIYNNYDKNASYDVNDNDDNPFPRYDGAGTNKHGSRCAGEVSMIANNNKCGVGVAYDSRIGGVRMLDGSVTDSVEARAVGFNCEYSHIYSASWGPTDDGKTMDGPGTLTREIIEKCIYFGRGGRGVIYVWASGNGGISGDHCGCDGYINSIYTIAVNSISECGELPWYAELCSSIMTVTNSGGAFQDHRISSIDLHDQCTNAHSGTSAAAPLAAGAIALVLEANSNLGWRDVQHIVVCTSETYEIENNDGWQKNGIGLLFNQRFGFGVLNIHRMTQVAANWTNVGRQLNCTLSPNVFLPQSFGYVSTSKLVLNFDGSSCAGTGIDEINFLEHVQIVFNVNYSRRGAVQIELQSPSGTISNILNPRPSDQSTSGFHNWTFMSVHFWGESPKGTWILTIADNTYESNAGTIISAELILRGTKEMPEYRKNGPKCGVSKQLEDVPCPATSNDKKSWWDNFIGLIRNNGKK